MTWGMANRPKISNKLGIPSPREGSDGDIQIRQTNLGAKLFGKIGGRWNSTFLSSEDEIIGTSGTKIGMDSSGAFTVDEIKLNGKITLTSTGTQNVCIGTGNSDLGSDNVSIGVGAGSSLTSIALRNICIGVDAGSNMANGDQNVLIGWGSGQYVTANYNTFLGYDTGKGSSSTANSGAFNVGIGLESLKDLTTAQQNVGLGAKAGTKITSGGANICVGGSAGDTIEDGEYNICFGYLSDAAVSYDEQIAIGRGVACDTAETLRIGDSGHYLFYNFSSDGGGSVSISSDERIKKDVADTDLGLNFINLLKPIKYTGINKHDWPDELFQGGVNTIKADEERKPDPTKRLDGFIAQDVKQVMDDLDVAFSGWHQNNSSRQMLDYSSFVVPLTKAVQELSAKVDTMQTQINNLT